MDALRNNPVPSILIVLAAVVGGIVVVVGALGGDTAPGGLTFQEYLTTIVAGAVGLGLARGLKEGLAGRPTRNDA